MNLYVRNEVLTLMCLIPLPLFYSSYIRPRSNRLNKLSRHFQSSILATSSRNLNISVQVSPPIYCEQEIIISKYVVSISSLSNIVHSRIARMGLSLKDGNSLNIFPRLYFEARPEIIFNRKGFPELRQNSKSGCFAKYGTTQNFVEC